MFSRRSATQLVFGGSAAPFAARSSRRETAFQRVRIDKWSVGGAQWGVDPAGKTRLGRYLDSKWGCPQRENGAAEWLPRYAR